MRQSLYLFILKLRNLLAQKFKQYDAKLPYLITVFIALIIVVLGVNVFIELTDTLESDMLNEWDSKITTYVISHRNPALTKYFMFVTDVGDLYGYLIVMG
ncbi:MAG: PAP2 family protein, partial [Bacteroidota bacterium]|nr:PAP2 family protein [Bacteroidota bacterium]